MLLGGHRGNPDEYPENTLASFRSAIELGVDVIECDVHRSEDGGLPVIHDHLLDRTSDGSGLVRDYTMAELKRFDAGSWKDPRFKAERIPSLDEVLGVARGRVGVAIEIKNLPLPYAGIEDALVRAIKDAGMVHDVVVISFDHRSIKQIAELEPQIRAADPDRRARSIAPGGHPSGDGRCRSRCLLPALGIDRTGDRGRAARRGQADRRVDRR